MAVEMYCVKCKAKKQVENAKETTMKNGRPMLKGSCPDCNTTVCKIVAKK